MRSVAFYSYKGGVGRSLALANVACGLSRAGLNVTLLDLDLEAPGLHRKLNVEWSSRRGLVDLAEEFARTGAVPHVADSMLEVQAPGPGRVRTLPVGSHGPDDPQYWLQLSGIDWKSLLYERDGLAFFLLIKDQIRAMGCDALLIDARTGISELGGVATNLLADTVVGMATATRESQEGLRAVLRSLQGHPHPVPDGMRLVPVLARSSADNAIALGEAARLADYLHEPAPALEATLPHRAPLLLTQDSSLQAREYVLLAEPLTSAPSLLVDYMVLLFSLFPGLDAAELLEDVAGLPDLDLPQVTALSRVTPGPPIWNRRLVLEVDEFGLTPGSSVTAMRALELGVPAGDVLAILRQADLPRVVQPAEPADGQVVLRFARAIEETEPLLAARLSAIWHATIPDEANALLLSASQGGAIALPQLVELLRGTGLHEEILRIAHPPAGWAQRSVTEREALRNDVVANALRHRDPEWAAALLDEADASDRDPLTRMRLAAIAQRPEQASRLLAALLGAISDPQSRPGVYAEALKYLPPEVVRQIVSDVLGDREASGLGETQA